jgi:transcriptional regulator with XRE-family HTH domain
MRPFKPDQHPDDITPEQFKALRKKFGFTIRQWARVLGFAGRLANVAINIRRIEKGEKDISPSTRRLCLMFARYGIPPDMMPPDDLSLGREEDAEATAEYLERKKERGPT